jgi:hypothetical protein
MLLLALRTLWTFPTTSVGLLIGGLSTPFGSRWQLKDGVLECHSGPVAWLLKNATLLEGGALAITFGDVVLARNKEALDLTRQHERVHVQQAHRWGPLFIPAYLTASALAMAKGKSPYRGNPFEIEAYKVSDARQDPAP